MLDRELDDHTLLEEVKEFDRDDPNKLLACVKLKLSLTNFSLIGDILKAHLDWFAKLRFSSIDEEYELDNAEFAEFKVDKLRGVIKVTPCIILVDFSNESVVLLKVYLVVFNLRK